jgi:hypothetical protein
VQRQAGLVVQDVLLGVDDQRRLVGDGGDDPGVGMAGARHPDPGGVVEIPLAANRLDPGTRAALDDQVGVAAPDRWHRLAKVEPGAGVGSELGLFLNLRDRA